MAVTRDGTQKFGIPDSPVSISNNNYIAEDVTIESPAEEAVIADDEGTETGRVIIPKSKRASGTLQLATNTTAIPEPGATFNLTVNNTATTFYLLGTSEAQTQQDYAKLNFTAVEQIN